MSTLTEIRESLGHMAMRWKPSYWLDTGIPDLNEVLGHRLKGLSFGRIIEIFGWQSMGKSSIVLALCALAQRMAKAHVVLGDVENSFDPGYAKQRGFLTCPKCKGTGTVEHVNKKGREITTSDCADCGGVDSPTCGLDTAMLTLIQPYVGHFSYTDPKTGKRHKEKNPRLSTAQELCSEVELAMSGHDRCVAVLDSVAALLTEGESLAGLENANMRSGLDLAMFMGRLLRRWVGLAQVHNCMIILVNQLRDSPKAYGGGDHTPGGNAPKFYSHVRVKVRRVKGGKIVNGGKMTGIVGVMKAIKNKAGGSENSEIGYRLHFAGPLEFVSAKEAKKNEDGAE